MLEWKRYEHKQPKVEMKKIIHLGHKDKFNYSFEEFNQ